MINFTAPFTNHTSYGICALNILKSLRQLGSPVSLFPIGPFDPTYPLNEVKLIQEGLKSAETYDKLAPSLRLYHQNSLAQHVGKGKHVGYPIFELDTFTAVEKHHLRSQDEVFVCSQWAKEVAAQNGIRAKVVPLGVDTTVFSPAPLPKGPTRFFTIGKIEHRKGHDVLCEIFNRAFSSKDDVELYISWNNPFLRPEEKTFWENNYFHSDLGEKIHFVGRKETSQEIAAFINSMHCGIFPTRAEGWCMPALETLACGRHLIITNCTGQTEFVNTENSLLIPPGGLEPAIDNVWFFGQGNWYGFGEEQIEYAVDLMRMVHNLVQDGDLQINTDGVSTAQKFSWLNTANKIWNYVE